MLSCTDLLLKLHHFHEALRAGGQGGAHLLHHGLDTMKVDASGRARLDFCSWTEPQSYNHPMDPHDRPAAEREKLRVETPDLTQVPADRGSVLLLMITNTLISGQCLYEPVTRLSNTSGLNSLARQSTFPHIMVLLLQKILPHRTGIINLHKVSHNTDRKSGQSERFAGMMEVFSLVTAKTRK